MRVGGAWLDAPGPRALLAALRAEGYRGLYVGGCVRDAALGRPVADIDASTDALPPEVMRIAAAAGFRTVPTGIDHGTVTVLAGDTPVEVTTFRRDVETDGRRAVVAFSTRIEDDAMRRDLTMNALYAEADGTVVDPLGGWDDLVARRVRFVGDPHERIVEDYLRILRFFRFHAWFGAPGGGIDPEGLAASAELAEGLERIARERIGAEMLKLLSAPDPAPAVATMGQAGILMRCLPGAGWTALAPLVHLEGEAGVAPDALRRLAAIGGQNVRSALRLSRADARRLNVLRAGVEGSAGPAEIAWRHCAGTAWDVALLRAAVMGQPLDADLGARIARGAAAEFPIGGGDLAAYQGADVGKRLRALQSEWIASDFTLDRKALLARA
ncbi:CCA tRNA nucleotidyltransferase [Palleronia sediminis]|uniref:CCA tRNA nucleotidyltransferase n=1 Tax=Palleronia sediminis TaxID=2547833 RepID=A0A4R6A7J5_9RHOB|nr:CCA tRNA nucleotidyltransferase [Palleronia sediminis]TDL78158.1 CCA tRNA nucleotidyltransferase [Palleronia sediminis]